MENQETYYPSANWAYITGNYTPEQLREIANIIEETHKEFTENQKG